MTTQQTSLLPSTPVPPKSISAEEAVIRLDRELRRAAPPEPPPSVVTSPATRLNDLFDVKVVAAAIASPTTASVTLSIEGDFFPPGNRVEVRPMVVVLTVPATVLPR